MKKILILFTAILFTVSFGCFGFENYVGPCHGFSQVGEFEEKITSETEAKQFALNYYSSIGYDFNSEILSATKIQNGWQISLIKKLPDETYCSLSANPPECIGQSLVLEENASGKNKILMSYIIPC